MADYRRLQAFREIVALVDAEFIERGMPLKPGAAVDMVAERAELIAERYGITPRSALKYLTSEAIEELAKTFMRVIKEHEAAVEARPPVPLSVMQAGLVISAFTVAARLGVVNGDPDVAADLCEVITRVSVQLRYQELSMPVARLPLTNGLIWARLCADQLSSGAWAVLPGTTGPDENLLVAARLRDDLRLIAELLQ